MKKTILLMAIILLLPAVWAMQYGMTETSNSWTTITFDQAFASKPLVFTQLNTETTPTIVRLQDITTNNFKVKLESATTGQLAWLAVSPEEYTTKSVQLSQAKYSTWKSVSFSTSNILVQMQDIISNRQPVQADIKLKTGGFYLRLEEPPQYDRVHLKETAGVLAIDEIDAEYGTINVDSSWTHLTFEKTYAEAPLVFAMIITENNGDMVYMQVRDVTTQGCEMRLADVIDSTHSAESIVYLIIGEEAVEEPEEPAKNIAVVSTSSSGVSYIVNTLQSAGYNVAEIQSTDLTSDLSSYDMLVYPGSSDGVYTLINNPGIKTALQNYVANGGDFLGICGGAILAANTLQYNYNGYTIPVSMLGLLDATAYESNDWMSRYIGNSVQLNFVVEQDVFGYAAGNTVDITYAAGPTFDTTENVVMRFNENLDSTLRGYAVLGKAAVITGQYGNGNVLVSSPHPEYNNPELLLAYVEWLQ